MPELQRFTSVSFRNYKALRQYSVALRRFNVLVGPNNSGKSTILGAFRILSEGVRKASSRNPENITLRGEQTLGYRVPLEDLPVSTENVFSDYDDSQPAQVEFRLSGGNRLQLIFPEQGLCYLVCRTAGRSIRKTSDFRREFRVSVGFVPVLGPVEHDEPLYQAEAARRALLTHRAARNFRNIWYHYGEDFNEFRELVRTTWPGMDIEKPEVDTSSGKALLRMFCPEERYPRRAVLRQITEHNRRTDEDIRFEDDVQSVLTTLSEPMKHMVSAQFLARRTTYERTRTPNLDQATITQRLLEEFESTWNSWDQRCTLLPGKDLLSALNRYTQERYKVTVTPTSIIDAMSADEVPTEIVSLITGLDEFRKQVV